MTFQLIDRERAHHAVSLLCSVLNVTRQGFWAWKRRPVSPRRLDDERLKRRILEAWKDSDRTYGAPRLHAELRLGGGLQVGKKRVARLMRELEIQGVSRRRGRVRTTTPDKRAAPAPDLVNRDFSASRPDKTWVADITYVPTHEGWLFGVDPEGCHYSRHASRGGSVVLVEEAAELVATADLGGGRFCDRAGWIRVGAAS